VQYEVSINQLMDKYDVPAEPDLISIDIDGNDYWVWEALNRNPRVLIIEYNCIWQNGECKVTKYDPAFQWDIATNYAGASMGALVKLGKEKGYTLVYACHRGVNLFFVRDDLVGKLGFEVKSPDELYMWNCEMGNRPVQVKDDEWEDV
jgi:hypothetical protein